MGKLLSYNRFAMPEAWTRHGMGVGFGNCARITVPLAPDLGLVLTPRGQTPRRIGTAEFNRATIYNSREFVAHHPGWQPGQSSQRAFDEDVYTQRWILPMIWEGSTSDRWQGTSGVLPKTRCKPHALVNHPAQPVAHALRCRGQCELVGVGRSRQADRSANPIGDRGGSGLACPECTPLRHGG